MASAYELPAASSNADSAAKSATGPALRTSASRIAATSARTCEGHEPESATADASRSSSSARSTNSEANEGSQGRI